MPKIYLGWENYRPYEFNVPNLPNEKEIIGYDIRKKDDQFWKRQRMPDFSKMTQREINQFIDLEHERTTNGVFFMNKGEPTYLTGMHYEHLMYNKFPKFEGDGYPAYYDCQREDFYFRELLMKTPTVYGGIWVKGRRYGLTAQEITNQLYVATHGFNKTCSMLSLEEKKTYKTLFSPLMSVLRNRPEFMKPKYYAPTGTEPQKKLEFLSKKTISTGEEELGSIIQPVPTQSHVLDGEMVNYATADEVFKWNRCDPSVFWDVTKETLKVGINKRGILNFTSTVGDDDKINGVAIAAGAKLWGGSDATQLNSFGETNTGLWKWFISSDKALEGFIDKHGFAMKDRAVEYIMNERSKHEEGSQSWLGVVRRYPLFENEVWNTVSVAKVFDTIRLNSQLMKVRTSSPEKDFGIIKGDLIRDLHSNKVYFSPTSNGKWEFAGLPNINSTNRFKITENGYEMPDDREYAVGLDPIRYTKTISKHLSKTSIVGIQKQSFDWKNKTDIVIPDFRIKCIYNYRTEVKEDSYADAINTALYLSAKIGAERQVSNFIEDYAQAKGYGPLLTISPYDNEAGIWTTQKSTEEGIGLIQSIFLRRPRKNSEIVEQQLDYLVECGFEKLIEQLKDFDPKNTTKFDIVMALIMAFFEYLQMTTVRSPELNRAVNDAMSVMFSKRS